MLKEGLLIALLLRALSGHIRPTSNEITKTRKKEGLRAWGPLAGSFCMFLIHFTTHAY